MKILVVSQSINRSKGGIATVVKELFNSDYRSHGFEMEHLVTHVEGSVFIRIFYFLQSLVSLIVKRNVGLMHIHVSSHGSFYRKSILTFVGRMKNIPVIMHIHGCDFDSFYSDSSSWKRFLIRKTLEACKNVLVLSSYWLQYITTHIIKDSKHNVELLYNGVYVPESTNSKLNTGNIHEFLFLGRLGQRKGVYDLIEAVNILVNQLGYGNLKFYLAGDGELEKVSQKIETYKLTKNVIVVGWLTDEQKNEYFNRAFTVVLPSYSEGLPMAILEAMAMGKVILSSKVGGIPELVEENKNGFLISPGNVEEIVQNVLYVFNNYEKMVEISSNNVEKIRCDYNLETLNRKLFQIYLTAMAS